jgi:hypothetical protein
MIAGNNHLRRVQGEAGEQNFKHFIRAGGDLSRV